MDLPNQTVVYQAWQPQLLAALTALDPEDLRVKVAAAEQALFWRGLDLNVSEGERAAMRGAARQLRALVVTVLGYPPVPAESEADQQHN